MVVEVCEIVDQMDRRRAYFANNGLSIEFEKPRYEIEYYPVGLSDSASIVRLRKGCRRLLFAIGTMQKKFRLSR